MDPILALKAPIPVEKPVDFAEKAIEMQLLNHRAPVNLTKMSERAADTNRLSFMSATPMQDNNRLSAIRNNLEEGAISKDKSDLRYTYTCKLARYKADGIELYDKELKYIRNTKVFRDLVWVDQVKERAEVSKTFYPTNAGNFEEVLDLLRFEECDYDKGVKWMVDFEIRNAEYDHDYKV